ncbi:MAG: glycosyltransferase family 9 protein, partial [Candidatus Helarchaeota archaeon]
MNLNHIEKVLIIKLRYLGDTVLISPVIKSLKYAYPHLKISVLVPKNTADILKYNPNLYEIISFDFYKAKSKRLMEKIEYNVSFVFSLRKRKFDMILDLTNTDRGAFFSILSGAKIK